MADQQARLEAFLSDRVGALGFDLDAVELSGRGKPVLRVAIDADGGVGIDDISAVTRDLSTALDTSPVMGEKPYTLEVTSRGLDRPLTLPRHWSRNVGRLVKLRLHDGTTTHGRIAESDDAAVTLGQGDRVVFADIERAVIEPELSKRKDS